MRTTTRWRIELVCRPNYSRMIDSLVADHTFVSSAVNDERAADPNLDN